jgi:hypothetical protein
MAVRNYCYCHGSLSTGSDHALHGVLVRNSGALMGAAAYAGMGHFPAHRFTSATITLFVLAADKNPYHALTTGEVEQSPK